MHNCSSIFVSAVRDHTCIYTLKEPSLWKFNLNNIGKFDKMTFDVQGFMLEALLQVMCSCKASSSSHKQSQVLCKDFKCLEEKYRCTMT